MKIGFTEDQLYTGGYTIKTTLRRATPPSMAKAAAEHQVPKNTDGIANTMAIVRPGKDTTPGASRWWPTATTA